MTLFFPIFSVEMTDFAGNTAYAEYSEFVVGPATDKYKLTVSGYAGNYIKLS